MIKVLRSGSIAAASASLTAVGLLCLGGASVESPEGGPAPGSSLVDRLHVTLQDLDNNRIIERYQLSKDNVTICDMWDGNQDGRLDSWSYNEGVDEVLFVRDLNADGKLDWWGLRIGDERMLMAKDDDFDGTPDWEGETEWRRNHKGVREERGEQPRK